MGEFHDEIPDDPQLIEWIKKQPMFHVATAPLHGELVLLDLNIALIVDVIMGRGQRECVSERV